MAPSNAYRDLVNQKLHFARLLLAQSTADSRGEGQSRDLKQALFEGAALHLKSAYRLYLREIADNYQCLPDAVYDIETLNSTLAYLNKTPGEVRELVNLEIDSESWLAQLMAVCGGKGVVPAFRSSKVATSSIAVAEVGRSTFNAEGVLSWQRAFAELIERQRELMVEC